MIYTVTLNPALDYIIQMDQLKLGAINRTQEEVILPGGKGINVSMVLYELGYTSVALGFVAGFTGEKLIKELKQRGIRTDFISVERGMTRINVKVKGREETEINGSGPEIPSIAVWVLLIQMERLKSGDLLVLAGSVPERMPEDIYEKLMSRLEGRGIKVVVDTAGQALVGTLKHRPFLVKPNHYELGELFGVQIHDKKEAIVYAGKLKQMGAVNVLVSMGSDGAILLDEYGTCHECEAPKGDVRSSVGAGDSMVAAFLASYLETEDYKQAFQMAVAAGSATAFSAYLATGPEILEVFHKNFS